MMILAAAAPMAREIQAQDVILLIVYLVLLLVGAYYLTKFVSRRAMQKGTKKPLPGNRSGGNKFRWKQGQMVSVVDRIPIDRDKTLMVVEFQNKHYLMATTGQDIKLLDTVDMKTEAQGPRAEEQGTEQYPEQDTAPAAGEESFFKKFLSSFKLVSRNYYRNKNTTPFGIRLRKELENREEQDIHPDNEKTGS